MGGDYAAVPGGSMRWVARLPLGEGFISCCAVRSVVLDLLVQVRGVPQGQRNKQQPQLKKGPASTGLRGTHGQRNKQQPRLNKGVR